MTKPLKLIVILALIGLGFLFLNAQTSDVTKLLKNVSESYEIKALKLPKKITFAGEQVPLNQPDTRERLDRELLVNTYWQSNGLLLLKRANKYFPIIEPILKKEGLPDDFKYLAIAESGLQNVRSRAGASGFWQFMKGTAKQYGLEVNDNVDERYNLEKATKCAAQYLKKAKAKFGTWSLAAAAYNAGSAKISKRLEQQKVIDYYDLLLNPETARYVFRIIALKEVLSNPKKYGFVFDKEDLYETPKYKEIIINTPIENLADFAKQYQMTYKELKLLNPWLRETKLDNKSGKEYIIKIKK